VIALSEAEIHALAAGAVVATFVERGTLTEGDEIDLRSAESADRDDLQPHLRSPMIVKEPVGRFTAVVESVNPAAILDPVAGAALHARVIPGDGDLVILRVYGADGAVLDESAFSEMRSAVEGALRM